MESYKLSIIIPAYNGEQYIDSCLAWLDKQSLKEIQVVFIDDGSTDDTLRKLNANSKPNMLVLSQKNAGAGAARNYGIANAKGEYIAFLDVDDRFAADNALELLYSKAKENDADICGGTLISTVDGNSKKVRAFDVEGLIEFEDCQCDFGFTRFIYRKEFLNKYKIMFPGYRVYEDPVFLLRAMVRAERFYAITESVYAYSGSHQNALNTKKTIDYLKGLKDNLLLSAKYEYSVLHLSLFEQLKGIASFYAELNLEDGDPELFTALLRANAAIDKRLLKNEGIEISEDYLIPALNTVWKASSNYMRLRKKFAIVDFLKGIVRRRR